jgi:two-component system response regulator QseB
MRILLIEDEEIFGDNLRQGLIENGYAVDWVKNGLVAWTVLQTEYFDLVILDLGLPQITGIDVLKNMRSNNISTPAIILTAQDTVDGFIKGLNSGADEYIIKPFNLEKLCTLIRAVLRRTSHSSRAVTTISVGDVTLDSATRLVFKAGKVVELSRREFVLLQMLMENADKVVSREQAAQSMYGWSCEIDSNALEVHIHNLRKKLNLKKSIKTIRGVGYMLIK